MPGKIIGSAGSQGSNVRSDIWIEIEIRTRGGIKLDFTSKVEALYGQQTRELIEEGLQHFNIKHANVTVEDQGALPFVIMARLETAVRRAFPDTEFEPWLPKSEITHSGSKPRRFRRSRLYLPGNQPKLFINAAIHRPDGLILDLEDSVAPAEKDAARCLVRNALLFLDFQDCERMVRINQGTRGLDDLDWVIPYGVQLILVPKVEDPDDLNKVAKRIAELRNKYKIKFDIWLMPIVESAKGAWFAFEIASTEKTVVALAIGLEDYTADIGAQRTLKGDESFWARSQVLNGARAAGVQPIDTVFSDVSDMEGLAVSVAEAKGLGFEGKGCIHPRQIDVVRKGFLPGEDEIMKAQKITVAFEEAEAKGQGVVSLGSKMIDPPVVKRALRVIRIAEEEGLIGTNWRKKL